MGKLFLGLTLGGTGQASALAVLDRDAERVYAVRHLRRWPPATGFPAVVADVAALVAALPAGSALAADGTDVGHPVLDLLREAGLSCRPYPVTVTAGHEGPPSVTVRAFPGRTSSPPCTSFCSPAG
jgi:hypothetical protein